MAAGTTESKRSAPTAQILQRTIRNVDRDQFAVIAVIEITRLKTSAHPEVKD
jgi:hypothetical protein